MMQLLQTLVTHCITVSISIVLWPFLFAVSGVNEVGRFIVRRLLPKGYELIEECFGNFVWSDMFNTRMVVVALFSEEENVSISKYQKRFQSRVIDKKGTDGSLIYGNLKKTQVGRLGYACLRDNTKKFKVENHVRLYDASRPENGQYFTEQELTGVILPEYLSSNMGESKPQWEFLVIPKVKRNDGKMNTLRIFRFDHRYMDGACAGVIMAEGIFDEWEGGTPPYVYDPNVPLPKHTSYWLLLTKAWAFLHLPLIVLLSLVTLIFPPGKNEEKPFTAWNNKGRKVFSSVYSLETSKMKVLGKEGKRNYNLKAGFLTLLGPVLRKFWGKAEEKDGESSATVATFQALLPYSPGLHNQFTILQTELPLCEKEGENIIDFPIDMTFNFAYAYTSWIGRLPIWAIRGLAAPADATVALNSVPFLRKAGSICGTRITEMASWDLLYTPVGLDFTVVGYDGKMFVTAFSVEECLSPEKINEIVSTYVRELRAE